MSFLSYSFLNSYPKDNIKKYGLTQTLSSTVTISGGSSSYKHNSTFYFSNNTPIATISGVDSGDTMYVSLSTYSGTNYQWYIETTTSGITKTSPNYDFYVRYLCSGICKKMGTPLPNIKVLLHRRSTGEILDYTTTAGAGTFHLDTPYNEEHYAVALHPDSDVNALIYDKLTP